MLGVLLQVCYPLCGGTVRAELSIAIVVVLSLACVAHAATSYGWRVAVAMLAITAGGGFLVEVVGARTGVPFGSYRYTAALGVHLFGVPLVVALAWTMLAWPAVMAARRLVRARFARVILGAWALTAADLFLDPQMVAAGYWRWTGISTHLPGVPSVPLSNLLGWVAVSLVLVGLLNRIVDRAGGSASSDTVAVGLYLWLWAGWTVALAIFLQLPFAALWGAIGMGSVAVPLAVRLRR
jgi:putative membrane protein